MAGICLHRMLPWRHLQASNANIKRHNVYIFIIILHHLFKPSKCYTTLFRKRCMLVLHITDYVQLNIVTNTKERHTEYQSRKTGPCNMWKASDEQRKPIGIAFRRRSHSSFPQIASNTKLVFCHLLLSFYLPD